MHNVCKQSCKISKERIKFYKNKTASKNVASDKKTFGKILPGQ